jgi:hypothetical protein
LDRRQLLKISAYRSMLAGLGACTQFNTLKAAEKSKDLPAWPANIQKIIFGSCLDQKKAQPIWQTILAAKPDLFIFGGDNVYASSQPWQLQNLKNAYASQAAQPGLAALRATVPHVAIWDDHDMGLNDGGLEFPHKQEAKNAFIDFWRLPVDDPRRAREGLYHAHVFGPVGQRVQVILLDTRWFRSKLRVTDQRDAPGKERYLPDTDPQKTMLGEAQWQWLETQLKQAAEVRLIVSGVQVIVEGHGWEGWGNPVAEAAALGLPVVTGTWPALEEMRALGVRDIPVAAPDAVERLLHALAQGAGHRVMALRSARDRSRLPAELASLLGRE